MSYPDFYSVKFNFADDWGTDEGEELTQIWKERLTQL